MTYDITLDQMDDFDPTDHDDVRCKRCGKTGLHWRDMGLNGTVKWVLFNDKLREHVCRAKPLTGMFDDET